MEFLVKARHTEVNFSFGTLMAKRIEQKSEKSEINDIRQVRKEKKKWKVQKTPSKSKKMPLGFKRVALQRLLDF
jgi:hypothetical protein